MLLLETQRPVYIHRISKALEYQECWFGENIHSYHYRKFVKIWRGLIDTLVIGSYIPSLATISAGNYLQILMAECWHQF